jgi:ATP-dependent Clp protease ATP-binding subunit ClpA
VNFKNTVIIMTSNVGSSFIKDSGPIGFSVNAPASKNDDLRARLMSSLRQAFRPEFLNRVDDIIVFNPLTREHLGKIIDIQLKRLVSQLQLRSVHMTISEATKDVLLKDGFDPAYGARPMRRAIQRLIQDPLSLKLLEGDYAPGDTVVVDAEDGKLKFDRQPAPQPAPVEESELTHA